MLVAGYIIKHSLTYHPIHVVSISCVNYYFN